MRFSTPAFFALASLVLLALPARAEEPLATPSTASPASEADPATVGSGEDEPNNAPSVSLCDWTEAEELDPLTPTHFSPEIRSIQCTRTGEHPDAWKGLTEDEISRVKKGEVVIANQVANKKDDDEGGAKAFIQAALIVNQPVDLVWRLLRETEKQHEFLPRLAECKLLRRDVNGDTVFFSVDAPVIDVEYEVIHHYDHANFHSYFNLNPESNNDLRGMDGIWYAYALSPRQTLMRYSVSVNFGWFIPKFIEEYLTRRDLPQAMENFRKRKESGGVWTKPD